MSKYESIDYVDDVEVNQCCYCHADVYESVGQLVTVDGKDPMCVHCPDIPKYHSLTPETPEMVEREDAFIRALPWAN